jgi:branched-subunit amino acid aminotransferase/4-amino-4-deoxychorismate lyase
LGVTDLGIIRGYGIFDFLKVEKGVPLFIEPHMERFQNSAKEMELTLNYSVEDLKKMVLKLIVKNNFKKGGMKIILTGGYSADGYIPSKDTNLIILLSTFKTPSKKVYQEGIKLMFHRHFRDISTVKTTNYIVPIRLAKAIKAAGAKDVLYHWNGKISESSRSNFFIVKKDNTIVTSVNHILNGITRQRTLKVANAHYKVIKKDITMRELKNAKEAFITSTTKGALPVVQIDDLKIGNGKVGEVAPHIHEQLQRQSKDYIKGFTA